MTIKTLSKRIVMDLRYSGKLTKEEYLAYVKLSNRPILKKNSSHIDMWVLFVYIGSFLSVISLVALFQKSTSRALAADKMHLRSS